MKKYIFLFAAFIFSIALPIKAMNFSNLIEKMDSKAEFFDYSSAGKYHNEQLIKFKGKYKNAEIYILENKLLISFSKKENGEVYAINAEMEFVNSNSNKQVILNNANTSINNIISENGINSVQTFSELIIKNIYNSIDFKLYTNSENELEYDFIVHQGGDPSNIELKLSPSPELTIEGLQQNLASDISLIKKNPYSYQGIKENTVKSNYRITSDNNIAFAIGSYDKSKDLIIDPVFMLWSTYFGGNADEIVKKVMADSDGNIYIAGNTRSNNIGTAGVWQNIKNNDYDGFVAKFNSSGVRLWCTYIGGAGTDNIEDFDIDESGNLYIGGSTNSDNLFNINAFQPQKGISYDAFLVKLSGSGVPVWATYCGGSSSDYIYALTLKDGLLYAGGATSSYDIMGVAGAKTNITGTADAFVAKYNADGNKIWSSYFGGNNAEEIKEIKIDNSNNIIIGGYTSSTTGIAYNSAHRTYGGGYYDSFVAKLINNGTVVWSSYIGGNDWDCLYSLEILSDNSIVAAGWTKSSGLGLNGFQNQFGGLTDGMVFKLDTSGTKTWFSYLGGLGEDYLWSMKAKDDNNIYVCGSANSTGLSFGDSYQAIKADSTDVICASLNSNGSLNWASYFGGNSIDDAKAICINNNDIIVAGLTESSNMFATPGCWQPVKSSQQDAFLMKITEEMPYSEISIINFEDTYICAGDTFFLSFNVTNPFLEGNQFQIELSDSLGYFTTPEIIHTIDAVDSQTDIPILMPRSVAKGQKYKIRVVSTSPVIKSSPSLNEISINKGIKRLTIRAAYSGLWNGTQQVYIPVLMEMRQGASATNSTVVKRIFTGFNPQGYLTMTLDSIPDGFYWLIFRATSYLPLVIPYQIELPSCDEIIHDFTASNTNTIGGFSTMTRYNNEQFYVVKGGDLNLDLRINFIDLRDILKPGLGVNVKGLIPTP